MNIGADPNAELVRHYLIERTPTGHVRLKGCPNEPDFGMENIHISPSNNTPFLFILVNLSALIYQHSVTPLALPVKLSLPNSDITDDYRSLNSQQHDVTRKLSVKDLLEKGAGKESKCCYSIDQIISLI